MPPLNLVQALRSPEETLSIAESDWNQILAQGRRNQLLGQFAARLLDARLLESVPEAVRRHLELELLTARRRKESALWEVATLRRATNPALPLILLKGGAYALSGDKCAGGRLFSDIDILVPRASLSNIEAELSSVGWKPSKVSDYDSKYYREWMHEVPPMEHVRRHTVIDLHHAINPPVSRFHVPTETLLSDMDEVKPGIFVLSAIDRVVHCGLHLLQEGEPKKLLRDLFDLFLLVDQHCPGIDGANHLMHRANELGVARQIGTAVSAAQAVFGESHDGGHQGSAFIQSCLVNASKASVDEPFNVSGFNWFVLAAYSHLMKMPIRLLAPHLMRKAIVRWRKSPAGDA